MVMFSLIGQSSASFMMSCDMMDSSNMPMSHNMTAADHDMDMVMNMSMTDHQSTTMAADCCQDNCNCATTSCNANTFTNSVAGLNALVVNTENNNLAIALPQEQFLNYLFKPPII